MHFHFILGPHSFISSAHIAGLALVFTPRYFFLFLHLFALIVMSLLSPVVQFSIVSLTVLMVHSLFFLSSFYPSDPLSFIPSPSLLTLTLSIHLSIRHLLFMNLAQREKKKKKKRIKMHLQLQEDSFPGVSVWLPLGFALAQRSKLQTDFAPLSSAECIIIQKAC